ncbi:MAG: SH3 domain-containing protein [Caldilinea sp.]
MSGGHKLLVVVRTLRRHWLLLAVILLAATLWVERSSVWAAGGSVELNQTIPPLPPTPTPTEPATPTPRPPTPTPTLRPNTGNQGQQPAPTATPVQSGAQSVATLAEENQTTASPLTASVLALTLNVRQGPGTTFVIIGRLTRGTEVTVSGRSADSAWLYICCVPETQINGWISAQFVAPNYTVEELDALPVDDGTTLVGGIGGSATITSSVTVTAVVSVPALNARAAPSTNAAILGRFTGNAQLTVLGRNSAGDWWLVCCAPNGAGNVWVASSFVQSNASAERMAALPVVTGRGSPVVVATEAVAAPAAAVNAASAPAGPAIVLTGPPRLLPAVQGEPLVMLFTVANPGRAAAANAEFSFELPAGLRFVSASATDGGEVVASETASGALLVVVTWPELAAGANATVRIAATVDKEVSNGAVLGSSAVALASNAASTFVSVVVGTPPTTLPDFR